MFFYVADVTAQSCDWLEGAVPSRNKQLLKDFEDLAKKFFMERRLKYIVCEASPKEMFEYRSPLAVSKFNSDGWNYYISFVIDRDFYSFSNKPKWGILKQNLFKAVVAHELAHYLVPSCNPAWVNPLQCEAEVDYIAARVVGYKRVIMLLRKAIEYEEELRKEGKIVLPESNFARRIELLKEGKKLLILQPQEDI